MTAGLWIGVPNVTMLMQHQCVVAAWPWKGLSAVSFSCILSRVRCGFDWSLGGRHDSGELCESRRRLGLVRESRRRLGLVVLTRSGAVGDETGFKGCGGLVESVVRIVSVFCVCGNEMVLLMCLHG